MAVALQPGRGRRRPGREGIGLGRWSPDEPVRLGVAEDLPGPQITRVLEINGLWAISREVVETARESLVIERSDP